jgi:hypothetical protein
MVMAKFLIIDDVADFLSRGVCVEFRQLRQIDRVDQGGKHLGLGVVVGFIAFARGLRLVIGGGRELTARRHLGGRSLHRLRRLDDNGRPRLRCGPSCRFTASFAKHFELPAHE